MLIDEIDTVTGPKLDDLTGILNDGNHVAGRVARCVGDNHDVKTFSVYCCKAFAGIGANLPDATRSRCIALPMARASGEALAALKPLRTDHAERWASPLRSQLARLAADTAGAVADTIGDDAVSLPDGIDGRDAQCWEPLLAVADLAGDDWGTMARAACLALVRDRRADDDGDVRIRLLRDLRTYFDEHLSDTATSALLIAWLIEDESRGWSEYRGRELTPHALARLLKAFKLAPVKLREGTATARVWLLSALRPAFDRYLPTPSETSATSATTATTAPLVPLVPLVALHQNGTSPKSSGAITGTDDGYWQSLEADGATLEAYDAA